MRAVARQRVDMRCRKIRVAMNAQVTPTLIIGEDDDDIGIFLWSLLGVSGKAGGGSKKRSSRKSAALHRSLLCLYSPCGST